MSSYRSSQMLGWAEADALAEAHGDSFFVLDEARFRSNFQSLRSAFAAHYPDVRIGYSYKTNYTPHLCRIVDQLGGYAEVVSEMEYALARRLGVEGSRIIFNGPYKSRAAFKDALLAGATINLDSLRDLSMLTEVAAAHRPNSFGAVIRCNFSLTGDDVSRFGFDVDGDDFRTAIQTISSTPNLRLKGLHCHFPDRGLESFGSRARSMVTLVNALFTGELPQVINIGGGYASNMHESLRRSLGITPASFEDYGRLAGGILAQAFAGRGPMPVLFLEPGTALVADIFRFYTRVISTKTVRGRNFATVAGSLFDISPSARSGNLPVTAIHKGDGKPTGTLFDVAGYTCIESDILSRNLDTPLAVDDFLCFDNVGSYSIVMKPPFILPANPVLMRREDGFVVVRRRESVGHVFSDFEF